MRAATPVLRCMLTHPTGLLVQNVKRETTGLLQLQKPERCRTSELPALVLFCHWRAFKSHSPAPKRRQDIESTGRKTHNKVLWFRAVRGLQGLWPGSGPFPNDQEWAAITVQGYWKGEKALTMPVVMTKGLEPRKCANTTQDSDRFRGGDSSGREETAARSEQDKP